MKIWPQSLQGQLALRLAAVFLTATLIGVGLLLWQGSEASDDFGLTMLRYRTGELAQHLARASDGRAELRLPKDLARLYRGDPGANLYAIRTQSGQVLASGRSIANEISKWHFERDTRNFRLEEFGPRQEDYYGLAATENSAIGPVSVVVAHSSDADAIAVTMLEYFARRLAWIIPLFALFTLAIGVLSIRVSLRPLAEISRRAAKIDQKSIDVHLPAAGLPGELVPLVQAVNSAFDRLQDGFAAQRRFTANAAHELRTPLTMLTAGLDELPEGPAVIKLRDDVARMNRLVSQLLRVARLDAVPSDLDGRTDLCQVATCVVEYLAPWAIAQDRRLGLEGADTPVYVRGNSDQINDAVRNLVENAIYHTPAGTEVTVRILPEGGLVVEDMGPGVPASDRNHIFSRFWRGKGKSGPGAGLGLSIVAEIVRLHGGSVDVVDGAKGGASFRLKFQPG
jgi:signal transduction histidine kinase